MTQEAIEILRVGIPDACLALGREEGFQEGLQEGRQEVLQETLRDLLAERFRVIPETLAEKILRIQESDLLKKWVVHFHKYKKLKKFEQDVDAALGQQVMA
jgi:flagellar biosynthesis/type III secretory pathway protein FliH